MMLQPPLEPPGPLQPSQPAPFHYTVTQNHTANIHNYTIKMDLLSVQELLAGQAAMLVRLREEMGRRGARVGELEGRVAELRGQMETMRGQMERERELHEQAMMEKTNDLYSMKLTYTQEIDALREQVQSLTKQAHALQQNTITSAVVSQPVSLADPSTHKSQHQPYGHSSETAALFTQQYRHKIQDSYNQLTRQYQTQSKQMLQALSTINSLKNEMVKVKQAEELAEQKLQLQSRKLTQLLKQNNKLQKQLANSSRVVQNSKQSINQDKQLSSRNNNTHVSSQAQVNKYKLQLQQKDNKIVELQKRISYLDAMILEIRDQSDAVIKGFVDNIEGMEDGRLVQALRQQLEIKTMELGEVENRVGQLLGWMERVFGGWGVGGGVMRGRGMEEMEGYLGRIQSVIRETGKINVQLSKQQSKQEDLLLQQNVTQQSLPQRTQHTVIKSLKIEDLDNLPLLYIEKSFQQRSVGFNFKPMFITDQNITNKEYQSMYSNFSRCQKVLKSPSIVKNLAGSQNSEPVTCMPLILAPQNDRPQIKLCPLLAEVHNYAQPTPRQDLQLIKVRLSELSCQNLQEMLNLSMQKSNILLQKLQSTPNLNEAIISQITQNVSNMTICQYLLNNLQQDQ